MIAGEEDGEEEEEELEKLLRQRQYLVRESKMPMVKFSKMNLLDE